MHTCIFRGFVVGSRRLLTWGFVRGRAVRRRHCVGGGAPGVSKYRGAVARRWRGGGAAAVARRRWRKVFDLRILTTAAEVLSEVEPCADFIVSAAAHRSI